MKCLSSKFIIFIIFLINNIYKINSELSFTYPSSISLTNGNILVIEKTGIYICDPTFEVIVNTTFTFPEEDQIKNETSLSNVIIKDKNGYIICLINFKIYFFSREGELLISTERLITDDYPSYVSLAPIFVKNNYYYYIICYFNSKVYLKMLYYKIYLSSDYQNSLILTKENKRFQIYLTLISYSYKNQGLSCEYMLDGYYKKYRYLICFLIISVNGETVITQDYFDVEESLIIGFNKYSINKKLNNVKLIKSLTNKDTTKSLVVTLIENNGMYQIKIYSFYYRIIITNFEVIKEPDFKCSLNNYGIKTSYIYEKNLLSFSCISYNATINSIFFNDKLRFLNNIDKFEECESIYGYSIIFSNYSNNYFIISDVICNNTQNMLMKLIDDNDTSLIDIKDDEEEEEEEGTIIINESQSNTYENEECKELEKCSKCDMESISKNLCIECNNEKGYYLVKIKDLNINIDNNQYIDCSDDKNKPDNFYFNQENMTYEPCFEENINFFYESNCKKNNSSLVNDTKSELVKYIKAFIYNNYEKINLDNGKDLEFNGEDIKITFTTTNNQKQNINSNKTTINLGKCEDKLKTFYNISFNNSLYVIKIDLKEEGLKIPIIEYEILYPLYNDELIILNLSICKSDKIDVIIPVKINDTIDKYNPNSGFYNDMCYKYTSKYRTDVSLNDRREEFINNNMSLCEATCKFVDYDYTNEKVNCSCEIKINLPFFDDITFDKNKLYESFTDIKNIVNLNLLKCNKEVFNINSIKKNIGFYIFSFLFGLFFICLGLFLFKSKEFYKNIIDQIIEAKINLAKLKEKEMKIIETEVENKNEKNIEPKKKSNDLIEKKNILNINISQYQSDKSIKLKKKKKPNKKRKKEKKNKEASESKTKIVQKDRAVNNNLNEIKETSIIKYKQILKYNDRELNSLIYTEALKKDNRTYFNYYISILKIGNLFLFSFFPNNDYNFPAIKKFLFFYFFAVHITINALFFDDSTMHKIYTDEGSFNFIYQIPHIIYSSLISLAINALIKYLSLSEKNILDLKHNDDLDNLNIRSNKISRNLGIKFLSFFIISFLLLSLFCYYIICFCGIFENTQIQLIKDSLISFGFSLLYPFLIYLIPGIFRIISLKNKKGGRKYLYQFSGLFELL